MAFKKLDGFDNEITEPQPTKEELQSVIRQLERHGDKEGVDFIVQRSQRRDGWSVFTNTKVIVQEDSKLRKTPTLW